MAFTPGVPANESFSPFIPQSPLLASGTINFDLIINEANPGVIFQGTEPNALVEVLREVGGSWWFVTNADWVQTAASFQQNAPCNPSLPAYAMVRTSDGKIQNFYAPATLAAGTNVSWQEVTEITGNGNLKVLSKTLTSGTNEPFITAQGTWAVGAGVTANAFVINLIDTSSNAGSALQLFNVGGVPKWQVLKDGTLNVGIVPWARITGAPTAPVTSVSGSGPGINVAPTTGAVIVSLTHGDYVDIGNAQTITGPKEFTSLVDADGGLDVEGGTTTDSLHVTGSETVDGNLHVIGTSQLDGAVTTNNTITAPNFISTGAGGAVTSFVGEAKTPVFVLDTSAFPHTLSFSLTAGRPSENWGINVFVLVNNAAGTAGTITFTPGGGVVILTQNGNIGAPPGNGIATALCTVTGTTDTFSVTLSYAGTPIGSVLVWAFATRVG